MPSWKIPRRSLVGQLPHAAQDRLPPHFGPSDLPAAVGAAAAEIDALRRRENALRVVVGSRHDGRDFIAAAAEALAVGLNYRWAGIGQLLPDGQRAQSGDVAGWRLAARPLCL